MMEPSNEHDDRTQQQSPQSPRGAVKWTPELRERIRKNRERALQIQAERKRKLQQEQTIKTQTQTPETTRNKNEETEEQQKKSKLQRRDTTETEAADQEALDCEEWEVGLPEWVSKKEAVAKYCLPEGTLAVCEVSTKDNPHHKGWAPMKLYRRAELRKRAYKRHGGKEGLIEERTKREQKRLAKDLKSAENIFES